MAVDQAGRSVDHTCYLDTSRDLITPAGSPGRGCLLRDPKHPVNPGVNTDDVSKLH